MEVEATRVKGTLTEFAAAVRVKDWDTVRAKLDPETSWYVGGSTVLTGQYEGSDDVLALLQRVVALGFDRPGCRTGEAEILVGDHHHGIFWFFNGEVAGEKIWSYEIWLVELTDEGLIGAVFFFAEDGGFQQKFWGAARA